MLSRWLQNIDFYILVPVLYLSLIGVVVQYSISNKTNGIEIDLNMISQLTALGLGFVSMIVLSRVTVVRKYSVTNMFFLVSLMLLVLVQVAGVEVNGSQRWINLGSFQLQPTEIAKLGLILYLARLFDTKEATVNKFRTVIQSFVVTAIPSALILLQPDLGSAVVMFVVWITILFSSRLKLSRFALMMITIIAGVLVLVPFMAEYQQERLVSYFNPEKDLSGSGYNVLQAGIAIGNGGLTGVGLDSGTQSQLNFLPSQHTDFIFAVVSEKLGLLGSMSIIIALTFLIMRISYLAWLTRAQFERGVLIGVAGLLFFHSFVNIGMNLGLVPVTGLPLPFISYGGTFMVVILVMMGVCLSISSSVRNREKLSNRSVANS